MSPNQFSARYGKPEGGSGALAITAAGLSPLLSRVPRNLRGAAQVDRDVKMSKSAVIAVPLRAHDNLARRDLRTSDRVAIA